MCDSIPKADGRNLSQALLEPKTEQGDPKEINIFNRDNISSIREQPRPRADSSIGSRHIESAPSEADFAQIGPLKVNREAVFLQKQGRWSKVGDFFAKVFSLGLYKGTRTFDQKLDVTGYTNEFTKIAGDNPVDAKNLMLNNTEQSAKAIIKAAVLEQNPELRSWEIDKLTGAIYTGLHQWTVNTEPMALSDARVKQNIQALDIDGAGNDLDKCKGDFVQFSKNNQDFMAALLTDGNENAVKSMVSDAIRLKKPDIAPDQLEALSSAITNGLFIGKEQARIQQGIQALDIDAAVQDLNKCKGDFAELSVKNQKYMAALLTDGSENAVKSMVSDAIKSKQPNITADKLEALSSTITNGLFTGKEQARIQQGIQALDIDNVGNNIDRCINSFTDLGNNGNKHMLALLENSSENDVKSMVEKEIQLKKPLIDPALLKKISSAVTKGLFLGVARHYEKKAEQIMDNHIQQFCEHSKIRQAAQQKLVDVRVVYQQKASPSKFLENLSPEDRTAVMKYLKFAAISINPDAGGNDKDMLMDRVANATSGKNTSGGVNGARFLKDNNNNRVFVKPAIDGIALHGNHDGILMGLKEATASAISKHLGLGDLVPSTMLIEIEDKSLQGGDLKGGMYNVSTFIPFKECKDAHPFLHSNNGFLKNPTVPNTIKIPEERRMQAVVFDFLISSQDRHYGNLGIKTIDPNHQDLVLIDNGYSQPMQYNNTKQCSQHANMIVPATFSYVENNTQITPAIKDNVRDKLTDEYINTLPLPEKSRELIKWKRDQLLDPAMNTMGDLRTAWIATRFDAGQGTANTVPGHHLGGFYDGRQL